VLPGLPLLLAPGAWRLPTALLLALLTALPRLPLIAEPVDVKPDGCEYLGIARHLAREGRWHSSIKWHFFNEGPPRHPALADRPPLYPLLAAAVWRLAERPESNEERTTRPAGPIRAVRLVNVALAALGTGLAFLLLARLVPVSAALGASVLLALYPAWMRDSVQPLTEPLSMALWLGALLLYYSRREATVSARQAALLGALGGLAYLARPSGLLLPIFFTLTFLPPLATRPAPRALPYLWGGFLLTWAPYGAAVAWETGSPFTSILSYNFSIRHIYEGTLYGFERSFPRPLEFAASRPGEIVTLVAQQTGVLLAALGRSLRFLLPLLLFLRPRDVRRHADLWLLAALNFGFHAVAWTVWGAGRYLLPTYLLVAVLLLAAPLARAGERRDGATRGGGSSPAGDDRARRGRPFRLPAEAFGAAAGMAWIGALAACLSADARLYTEKALPHSGVRMGWAYRESADWLRRASAGQAEGLLPEDAAASNQPWILNLLAERPARIAPRFRDAEQARRFSDRYRPRWLVYFAEEPEDFAVLERIAPLREGRRTLAPALHGTWEIVRYAERRVPIGPDARARRVPHPDRKASGRSGEVTGVLWLERI
jgi:hypothetical protein